MLGKSTVRGFENPGGGITVDVLLSYDRNGTVGIQAELAGRKLEVLSEDGYGDISWISRSPSQRALDHSVDKEIAYCIDLSRSMWGELGKVTECVRSSSELLDGPNTRFTLIGFADR